MKVPYLVLIFGISVHQCKLSVAQGGIGNFCGVTYTDAAATCAVMCPGGLDSQCPSGTVEILKRQFS